MGTRAALDNIRYFLLHVLPRAEAGAPWTESDLSSALSWADYCQDAASSAAGTAAEPILAQFVTAAAAGARRDLDVALLRRARRALLSRLLQNSRAGDAALRRAVTELRRAGQLDAVLAVLAAQKQAYSAVAATLRRAGGRRRLQALAFRRYLSEGVLAGRQPDWLREKAAELAAGPDGPRMTVMALCAAPADSPGSVPETVDAALERQLAAAADTVWTGRLSEQELRRLLARPSLAAALEAAAGRLMASGADMDPLLRAVSCDESGRLRRRLRTALRERGDAGRQDRAWLAAQLPCFRLHDPADELDEPS